MENCNIKDILKNLNKKQILLSFFIVILIIFSVLMLFKKYNEIILEGEIFVKETEIYSKIPGTIDEIITEEGETIKKGGILATVSIEEKGFNQGEMELQETLRREKIYQKQTKMAQIEDAKISVKNAEDRLLKAKINYDYAKKMFENKKLTKEKTDDARKQFERAQNEARTVKSNLLMYMAAENQDDELQDFEERPNVYQIKADEDGEISSIEVKNGDFVNSGTPVLKILNAKDMWVEFDLREDLLKKFQDGKTFIGEVPAIKKRKVHFMVTKIAPKDDISAYRSYGKNSEKSLKIFKIRAVPIDNKENLKKGMTVFVSWNKI